jgi:hypothetical protein
MDIADDKPKSPTHGGSYTRTPEGELEKAHATVQLDDPEHPANAAQRKEQE